MYYFYGNIQFVLDSIMVEFWFLVSNDRSYTTFMKIFNIILSIAVVDQ